MANKRAKKKARKQSSSVIKSIFFYGKPNKAKKEELVKINEIYLNGVNNFINILCNNTKYLKEALNSSNKAPAIRQLEKDNRISIGSAYGQSAIDYAMIKASQYEDMVHKKVMSLCSKGNERAIAGSIFLYVSILQGTDYNTIITDFNSLIENDNKTIIDINNKISNTDNLDDTKKLNTELNKADEKLQYHLEMKELVESIGVDEFNDIVENIAMYHDEALLTTRIPTIKHCDVQLDSRLFTLETPDTTKSDKVISIKGIGNNSRIVVPIYGSQEGLRRLEHYNKKNAVTFSFNKNGTFKVSIPFEKKVKAVDASEYVGVDIGITDYLHTDSRGVFGSGLNSDNFYRNEVEPALAKNNVLRNQMREYRRLLKQYKDASDEYKNFLRTKIHNINTMLQSEKKSKHLLNKFHTIQEKDIKDAVLGYVTQVRKQPCLTVLELLDINEFDSCKELNGKRSAWARSKLTDKLIDTLEWYGLPYIQVEPAFTSKVCPICGNLDDDNRDGKHFECTCCGHADDADHNASVNIKNRATDEELLAIVEENQYDTKERHAAIRLLYEKRHADWLKTCVS